MPIGVAAMTARESGRPLGAAQAGPHARRARAAQVPAEAARAITQPDQSSSPAQRVADARAALAAAAVSGELGAWAESEALARRAVDVLDQPPDGDIADCAVVKVAAFGALGSALRAQGRYGEAETPLLASLALAQTAHDAESLIVHAATNLGVLYKYTGHFDEAEALYRRALQIVDARQGPEHVDAATLWHNLGGLEHSRGRHAQAEPAARRALTIRTHALGAGHPDVAADAAALGAILDALGRLDEAEELLRGALQTFTTLLGPCHYEVAINTNNLAAVQYRRGRIDDAETLWRQALTIKQHLLGNNHPELAATIVNLGVLASARGQTQDARTRFEHALTLLGPDITAEHPVHRAATHSLAKLAERKQTAQPRPAARPRRPLKPAARCDGARTTHEKPRALLLAELSALLHLATCTRRGP
ncbi:MAG: tetratricopeptide repeat protein [Actinobacteria bacterium]|nr:tetratricopeptide repeat protein [Actinomycetota bacterium]